MKGSLSTMNYLEPKGFFNKLLAFFKSRHTASLETQYNIYGARAFEFRIDFDKNGKAFFKYGGIEYLTDSIYSYLNYLDGKGNVMVKILLEDDSKNVEKEKKFNEYCSAIEKIYQNIAFTGGYRTYDLKLIYRFKYVIYSESIDWIEKFN